MFFTCSFLLFKLKPLGYYKKDISMLKRSRVLCGVSGESESINSGDSSGERIVWNWRYFKNLVIDILGALGIC